MEQVIFRDDRHIYLKDCVIAPNRPPMSVFMEASHGYDILSIQSHIKFLKVDDVLCFGRFLGETVTEVVLDTFDEENRLVYMSLRGMPLIKSLTFVRMPCEKVAIVLSLIHSEEPAFRFIQLEKLELLNSRDRDPMQMQSFLKAIKKFIRNEAEIMIDYVTLHQETSVKDLLQVLKRAIVKCFKVSAFATEEMQKLIDAEILSCEQLNFVGRFDESPFPFLELG